MNRRGFLRIFAGTIAASTVSLKVPVAEAAVPVSVGTTGAALHVERWDLIDILTKAMLEDIQYEEDLAWLNCMLQIEGLPLIPHRDSIPFEDFPLAQY